MSIKPTNPPPVSTINELRAAAGLPPIHKTARNHTVVFDLDEIEVEYIIDNTAGEEYERDNPV